MLLSVFIPLVLASGWETLRDPELATVIITQRFGDCDVRCDARRTEIEAGVDRLVDTDGSTKEIRLVLLDLDRSADEVATLNAGALKSQRPSAAEDSEPVFFIPSQKARGIQSRPRKFAGRVDSEAVAKFLTKQLQPLFIECDSLDDCQARIDEKGGAGFIGQFRDLSGDGREMFEESALQMRINGSPLLFAITGSVSGMKQKTVDEDHLGRVSIRHPGEWRLVMNVQNKEDLQSWMEVEAAPLYGMLDSDLSTYTKPDWLVLVGEASQVGSAEAIEEVRGVALPLRDEYNIGWTDNLTLARDLADREVKKGSLILIRQGKVYVRGLDGPVDADQIQDFIVDCAHKRIEPVGLLGTDWKVNQHRMIKDLYVHNVQEVFEGASTAQMLLMYNPRQDTSHKLLKEYERAAAILHRQSYPIRYFKFSVVGAPQIGVEGADYSKVPFILFKEGKQSTPRMLDLPSQKNLDAIVQQMDKLMQNEQRKESLASAMRAPVNVTLEPEAPAVPMPGIRVVKLVSDLVAQVSARVPRVWTSNVKGPADRVKHQANRAFKYIKGMLSDEL